MGTDRSEYHRGPCLCGAGEFVIAWEEPDHGYPSASGDWRPGIECAACRERYTLVLQDGKFIVVDAAEVRRRRELADRAFRLSQETLATPQAEEQIGRLVELCESQPSMAAAYRLLRNAGVMDLGIERFRKRVRYRGYQDLIKDSISHAHQLPGILRLVGQDDSEYIDVLQQIEGWRSRPNLHIPRWASPFT